jgi:hypothetical protein
MLYIERLESGTYYTVTNNQGDILIYTTSSAIADYVERRVRKVPRHLRLAVGGDSKRTNIPNTIWRYPNRFGGF